MQSSELQDGIPPLDTDLTSGETIQKFLPLFRDALLDIRDFEPFRAIGEGGFAVVYKCRRISAPRELVAVKILKSHLLSSPRDVYDFLLEAQLLRKLKHSGIVQFRGVCYGRLALTPWPESICVVTDLMDGGTLKEWIVAQSSASRKAVYSKRTALLWMTQVAEGLEYLHSRNFPIVHRDMKPENILLQLDSSQKATKPVAKIADFGLSAMIPTSPQSSTKDEGDLAKVTSEELPELLRHGKQRVEASAETLRKAMRGVSFVMKPEQENDHITAHVPETLPRCMTGKTGSLLYMAPEVLRSELYNEKVDVFSFGTVLYEILMGRRIAERFGTEYTRTNVQKFAEEVRDGYRLPIPSDWPTEIQDLIRKCWQDDPKERPSMSLVAARLNEMYASGMFSQKQQPRKSFWRLWFC